MKSMNLKTMAIFGMAVMVVASGAIGFNFASMFPTSQKASTEGLPFLGHIEVVAKDPNGNIKAYRQSDNVVIRSAKACVGDLVFGFNTTRNCYAAKFQHIGIGNNSTTPSEGQTSPVIGLIGSRSVDTAPGLDNATATVGAKATIDKAFTINGTDTIRQVEIGRAHV